MRKRKTTRAEILEFVNDGKDESNKLRPDEVAFFIRRGNLRSLSKAHRLTTLHGMAKKVTSPAAKIVRERPNAAPKPATGLPKPSSLVDTRVIYCGDNLEQ